MTIPGRSSMPTLCYDWWYMKSCHCLSEHWKGEGQAIILLIVFHLQPWYLRTCVWLLFPPSSRHSEMEYWTNVQPEAKGHHVSIADTTTVSRLLAQIQCNINLVSASSWFASKTEVSTTSIVLALHPPAVTITLSWGAFAIKCTNRNLHKSVFFSGNAKKFAQLVGIGTSSFSITRRIGKQFWCASHLLW